jgi:hypothetical protein
VRGNEDTIDVSGDSLAEIAGKVDGIMLVHGLDPDKNNMWSEEMEMTLIKCGTKALTKMGHIEGIVTAISIRFNRAQYELSYFHNGEYKTMWMDESEFDVDINEKVTIGFK